MKWSLGGSLLYRYINPNRVQYTYVKTNTNKKERLDRIYVTGENLDRVITGSIKPNTFSDHSGYMIKYKNEYMEQPEATKTQKKHMEVQHFTAPRQGIP